MRFTKPRNDGTIDGFNATALAMRLEIVVLPVADVDRAKSFYQGLGWRLDADTCDDDDFRVVQLTPPGSSASIIFGAGLTSAQPGAINSLVLVVDDLDAAHDELLSQGVEVSEVFHDEAGGLGGGFRAGLRGRAMGRDPQGRSYASYASFRDPDGNGWLLQEITERLPGRV
jgi:catechol 2,3-dioxygenase-like lactoylglutathione lyase family enzyme